MFHLPRGWWLFWSSLLLGAAAASGQAMRCADLSSLEELEAGGAVYTEAGDARSALEILQARGLGVVRLRLFHSPIERRDALEDVLHLARRADDLGLQILLDLHYSDTWADPGQQMKPAAWAQLSSAALEDSVYAYTHMAVTALVQQGTAPVMVQIGNEITSGMLWDTGRVGGAYDTSAQWEALARLLERGIAAVRAGGSAQVMLHIDRGGDATGAQWFFDRLAPFGLDFDVIGLSYYPWWHGDLTELERTTRMLRERYNKHVLLAETAYPWTLGWNDDYHNQVGLPEHVLPDFPSTPEGQANFLAALWRIVPEGLCYWSAELIAAPGYGSAWENLALFDFQGEVLPAASVLAAGPTVRDAAMIPVTAAIEVFPNPLRASNPVLTVRQNGNSCAELKIFDSLGRLVLQPVPPCGAQEVQWSLISLVPGVYWIHSADGLAVPLLILP